MEWLNYHHLLYFWVVAREGSISRACELLELAQPTISHQIHELEEKLGRKLFTRVGRNIQLTDHGRLVYTYANEIFTLGRELLAAVKGQPQERPQQLLVGIAGLVPKLLVYRLLEAALQLETPVRLICREDKAERLLADLALRQLDLILSDAPVHPVIRVRAYNHRLGECGVTFFGTSELAARYRKGFPQSLNGAPLLLPTDNTGLRRSLDQWLDNEKIHPDVRGEFSDSSLLKMFGQVGTGLFVLPSAVEKEVVKQYGVQVVGQVEAVRARCYVISVEKKVKHPAWEAIAQTARQQLFPGPDS